MARTPVFRPHDPDQFFLLPSDLLDWLLEYDLVFFIVDVVNALDLSALYIEKPGVCASRSCRR